MPSTAKPTAKPKSKLLARDLMRVQLVTIDAGASLSEVERILSESRISGAPVIDRRGTIVGVVSVRDLIERYAEAPESRSSRRKSTFYLSTEDVEDDELEEFETPQESEETAADVMTPAVHTIDADATLEEVARTMAELVIHRILVTENARIVGLISSIDVLRGVAGMVGRPRPAKKKAKKA